MNWTDFEFHSSYKIDDVSPYEQFKQIVAESNALIREGIISSHEEAFFILNEPNQPLFRKKSEYDLRQKIWLSKAYKKSKINLFENKIPEYKNNIDIEFIREIAKLSRESLSILRVEKVLNSYGISLIFEEYTKNLKIDGACYTLPNGTPCIAISNRFKRANNIWFTLLHELAHIALHYERLNDPIIDDSESDSDSVIERQANNAASNAIAPRDYFRSLNSRTTRSLKDLITDSEKIGTNPALLAGLIQYSTKRYDIFTSITNDKKSYEETINGVSL